MNTSSYFILFKQIINLNSIQMKRSRKKFDSMDVGSVSAILFSPSTKISKFYVVTKKIFGQ